MTKVTKLLPTVHYCPLYALISETIVTMSNNHSSYCHCMSLSSGDSSIVPDPTNRAQGFFIDTHTHHLLAVQDGLLHSGSYGDRELGSNPILLEDIRDPFCRFLPFAEKNHNYAICQASWQNYQGHRQMIWSTASEVALHKRLNNTIVVASGYSGRIQIPIPAYAWELFPRFCPGMD